MLLTIILSIFLVFFKLFSWIFILVIFFGLLIGQLLHLLEDSTTIAGIDWKFPFGTKKIHGSIYTWNKLDSRPTLYSFIFGVLSLALLLGYLFDKITFSLWLLYPILFVIVILLWVIFLWTSRVSK